MITTQIIKKNLKQWQTIFFAFKTKQCTPIEAEDNGYQVGWDQYYLANINGQMKLIKTHIASSIDRGAMNEISNVIQNTQHWSVSITNETSVQNENISIYEKDAKNVEKSMEL